MFPLQKLEAYKQQCPALVIQWEEASNQEVIDKVLKRELDVGFVIGQMGNRELWGKELFHIQLSVLVYEGHPFYERESLSVQDLQGEPLISLNEKFSCYHSLVERCRDFGFVPDIVVKTMEGQLIYRFCKERIGLGIVVDIHRTCPCCAQDVWMIRIWRLLLWKTGTVISSVWDDRCWRNRIMSISFVPAGGMRSGPASPAMKAVWAGSRNIL